MPFGEASLMWAHVKSKILSKNPVNVLDYTLRNWTGVAVADFLFWP